jgi:hypothetical protein
MAKYVDRKFRAGRFYLHIGIVDLFVRERSDKKGSVYPVASIDILFVDNTRAVVFTIPVMAVTIGYIRKATPPSVRI